MAKKIIVAAYDIEIRDSVKKLLSGLDFEFIDVASGISLAYKSVELNPDLVIMSFSPANLAAYNKIRNGAPDKTSIPVILLLPPVLALQAGTEIKLSEIVKDNLLINLGRDSYRQELLDAVKVLLGTSPEKPKTKAKENPPEKPGAPTWNEIVEKTKENEDPVEVNEEPVPPPSADKNPEEPKEEKLSPEEAAEEKKSIIKAKMLIDDLLEGKPKDEKKYNISRSMELIDDIVKEAASPTEVKIIPEAPPEKEDASPEKREGKE